MGTTPPKKEKPRWKIENIIWLDKNVNNEENTKYQNYIRSLNKYELSIFTEIPDCLQKLKELDFEKTYIMISGSISKEFFSEFEKIINDIKICPMILIFTSKERIDMIKNNIISLDSFSFFEPSLVYCSFKEIQKLLLTEEKYRPHEQGKNTPKEENNYFSFEYIKESKDLILPLTFVEFMEIPCKAEILYFNEFLIEKYSNSPQMIKLIKQLLSVLTLEIKIPFPILVKYWVRAYTLESTFYKDMNFYLEKKEGNNFDPYIRVLYQGLLNKVISPYIEETLYRGALIKLKEVDYIKEALNNKKENLPGCICYNKAFLSSSLDKNVALTFLLGKIPDDNEERVLYIFEEGKDLDKENATNASIEDYSFFKNEREILFFPFSSFQITKIKYVEIDEDCRKKINEYYKKKGKPLIKKNMKYYEVYLSYIGKYKTQIDKNEKIPENGFTKIMLSSNVLEKLELGKDSNKDKFDFDIDKYIPQELKTSYIIAAYDITDKDINKKIQIINCDENINKSELEHLCEIFYEDKKIDFTYKYEFNTPGKKVFMFKFNNLLQNGNKLFFGCNYLISLKLEKFKSNYFKDMTDMFNGCCKLEKLDLSSFKTKDVKSMKGIFKGCTNLKSVDVSTFDTYNVEDMSEMFCDCTSLTFLNLSNFQTEKVKTMYRMFYNCKLLFFINLSSFKSNKMKNFSEMFAECSALKNLNLSNFEIGNDDKKDDKNGDKKDDINTDNMFFNCSYFNSLKNEYLSEITDENIYSSIKKITKDFLDNQTKIIEKDFLSKHKYVNIDILNQTLEEIIKKLKHINILLLGEKENESKKLLSYLSKEKNAQLTNNYYEIECFRFFKNKADDINNVENIINEFNKNGIDSSIHCIWYCIQGEEINNNSIKQLNILMDKYVLYFIYLNSESGGGYQKFKDNLTKIFPNKKYEIISISFQENNERIDEILKSMKNNLNFIIYQTIKNNKNTMEIIKDKIEKEHDEKDLDELAKSLNKYFEKLVGNTGNILIVPLEQVILFSKEAIKTDVMNYLIDNFKQTKLRIKFSKKQKKYLKIENLSNELNKELEQRYSQISSQFFANAFKEEFYLFFKDFLKNEAEKIIARNIKDLKLEDLNPLVEKNLSLS